MSFINHNLSFITVKLKSTATLSGLPPLMKDLAIMWLSKQQQQQQQQQLRNQQQQQYQQDSTGFAYRCDACGKGYQHKATLLRHTRHECGKEPKFKCPYCVHRTKQKGNLYQHIRTNHPGHNVYSSPN